MKLALILGAVALCNARDDKIMLQYFRTKIVKGQTTYDSRNWGMHWNAMRTMAGRLTGYDGFYSAKSAYVTGGPARKCALAVGFERHERINMVKYGKSVCFRTWPGSKKGTVRGMRDPVTHEIIPYTYPIPDKYPIFNIHAMWTTSNYKKVGAQTNMVPMCFSWNTLSYDLWGQCSYQMDWQHYQETRVTNYSVQRRFNAAKVALTTAMNNLKKAHAKLNAASEQLKATLKKEKVVIHDLAKCQDNLKNSLQASYINEFRYRMESIYLATRDESIYMRDIGATFGGSDVVEEDKVKDVWWESNRAKTF